jgi:glycosyltransferase involved in cell wall biosynthesis
VTRISVLELVASSRGGGAVHVRDLALGLDPTRLAVQLGMAEDGGNVGREDFVNIPFHPLDIATGFSLSAIWQLCRLLPTVDIVHLHGARAALFGRLAALTLGHRRPRVIYSIHGFAAPHYPTPRRQVLLAVEHGLAPVTDLWICVSHAEKEALLEAGLADARRVHVIWNGIDLQRFLPRTERGTEYQPRTERGTEYQPRTERGTEYQPRTERGTEYQDTALQPQEARLALGVPADSFVVTSICRLFRPRDFPTLLGAFQQVRERLPHAHLLIVGDGPLRPQVEATMAALHLEDTVHLLGMRRDVPRLLRATDVLVLASKGWEGLPLTVLEAMASSLPVVASDVGGTREAIVDGETGVLFPPGDAAALAQGILSLAGDPLLAQQMGQRGLARVREHFTFQRMARETAALYEQLLS